MTPLSQIARCFEAIIPGMLTTCSQEGVPNMIAVSYVHRIDDTRVAISRQFFRKTHANLLENPRAQVAVMDPVTMETFRLDLRFSHEETSGPIFDILQARVDAVAAHTGMSGVFRVAAAGIFDVLDVEHVPCFGDGSSVHLEGVPDRGLAAIDSLTQLRALRRISDIVRTVDDADALFDAVLGVLEETLGFEHSMILLVDETGDKLYAIASRGYAQSGVGAEVKLGDGIIGMVARTRRLMRTSSLTRELRYARATRGGANQGSTEIPLPGLADAQSQLALPLVAKDEVLGVLAVESRHQLHYGERDEAFLEVAAGQVAFALQALLRTDSERSVEPVVAAPAPTTGPVHRFTFFRHDDCVFLDGEYLVRNIPGRMLWKLLQLHACERRIEFSNRELRLDTTLGLPQLRDNLESRLILLRKRLAERCEHVRLVPVARGRFRLDVNARIELEERP
jgi:adenylate cyclase